MNRNHTYIQVGLPKTSHLGFLLLIKKHETPRLVNFCLLVRDIFYGYNYSQITTPKAEVTFIPKILNVLNRVVHHFKGINLYFKCYLDLS